MKKTCVSKLFMSAFLVFVGFAAIVAPKIAIAQDSKVAAKMGSKFVPDNAFATLFFSPSELLKNPAIEWFPIEVLRAYSKEQFGVDPQTVSNVKAVWGLSEVGELQFGMVFQLTENIDLEKLIVALHADPEPTLVEDRMVYAINGPEEALYLADARTIYAGMMSYLAPVIEADDGSGSLPMLLKSRPARPGINVLIAMESIRQMVSDVVMQGAVALAPDLQALAQLPELTDTAQLNVNTDGESIRIGLTLVGIDESAAVSIESTISASFAAAKRLAIAEVERSMNTEDASLEMREASLNYAERLSSEFIQTLTPNRNDKDVTLTVESKLGFAGSSILAGFLVPAMQSARFAASRMSAANNMKQVMLGLHNFHAAYNKLPTPAITDAAGKPLLSWRVALLPFVEEQGLYTQFHLDEPWDSEHNLPLSKRLPAVYTMTSVGRLPAGETVIQAVVGDTIGMRPKDKTGFRDFLDGLSISVLIVQASADSAVPWSKPADVEIDLADPLENLVGNPKKGFYVGMGDGAVRFISDNIDPKIFKALLSRAGREAIDLNGVR